MEEGTYPVKPCNVLPRNEVHPSNISGRHARDTDTGPWHIAYRLRCKTSQSGGGSPTSQGPRWSFVNFFINMLSIFFISHVGQGLHLYLFPSQEQEMMDDSGLSKTLQSYYTIHLALDWLRAAILDC